MRRNRGSPTTADPTTPAPSTTASAQPPTTSSSSSSSLPPRLIPSRNNSTSDNGPLMVEPAASSSIMGGTSMDNNNNNNNDSGAAEYFSDPSSSNNNNDNNNRPSLFVIQVTAIASLGGILFGYDLGVISSALPQMIRAFDLTVRQQEVVVSVLYVGGGLGALFGGSLCDAFGRKRAILVTDVWFALGALILLSAPNLEMVVLGRVVVGVAVAVSGIADVSYLHEIAPIQWRGAIVSVNEAAISLGFLLAFAAGSLFSGYSESGWRIMFGVSGILACIQWIGMLSMPESPKWLEEQGRHEEAEAALERIHSHTSSSSCCQQSLFDDREFAFQTRTATRNSITLYEAVTTPAEPSTTAPNSSSVTAAAPTTTSSSTALEQPATTTTTTTTGTVLLLSNNNRGLVGQCAFYGCQLVYLLQQLQLFAKETALHHRRQAYIALFLAVTQQFCGQTNVLSYAPLIFARAHNNAANNNSDAAAAEPDAYVQGWATLSIGLVKFAVTVLVIWKIERIGRRVLLLLGMATISVGLLLLAIAFGGTETATTSNDNGDQDELNSVVVHAGSGFNLAMPGVLLVVSGYSMSFGPLTWLLTSELFPTDIRGRALGFSTIVTYVCAALVTVTFLSAQEWLGASVVFCFYLLVTSLGFFFAYAAIPDTKEKSCEQIEHDLIQMLWWQGSPLMQRNRNRQGEDASPLFGTDESGVKFPESELT